MSVDGVRARAASGAQAVSNVAKEVSKEQKLYEGIVKNSLSSKIGDQWAERLAPVISGAMAFFKVIAPLIVQGFNLAKMWYEALPMEYVQLVFGLTLCFFGGVFQASIAAVEAFKLCGWDKTRNHMSEIYSQVKKVIEAQDDKKTLSKMSADQLLMYETRLILSNVDPDKMRSAASGLVQAWIGVIASLQSEFAKTVALGSAMATTLQKSTATHIVPFVAVALDQKHHHWIPVITDTLCKSIAVSIAWFVQRIISAVHAALRGGSIFVNNAIKVAKAHGMLQNFDEDKSNLDETAAVTIALVGFFFQLKGGFALSFPLNIVLFPLTLIEWFLVWSVGAS